METFRWLHQNEISREIFLVTSHPMASFWRLTTIPKALFLLFHSSYRISSHHSALSRSRAAHTLGSSPWTWLWLKGVKCQESISLPEPPAMLHKQHLKASFYSGERRSTFNKCHLLSVRGMEMTTPFPVPTQRRLPAMSRAVILTKEKPSFPVPRKHERKLGSQWGLWARSALGKFCLELSKQGALTKHLADVRLNVDILQMLMAVGMIEPQRGVQADGNPHSISNPCQLSHLALPTRMGIKGFLK